MIYSKIDQPNMGKLKRVELGAFGYLREPEVKAVDNMMAKN